MRMFDLRRTLTKYIRAFFHEKAVLTIGQTDQSDYSICYFMVRLFIHTVQTYLIWLKTDIKNARALFMHLDEPSHLQLGEKTLDIVVSSIVSTCDVHRT